MVATLGRAQLREQISAAADRVSGNTADAALRVLLAAGERRTGAAFAARVLRAVAHLIETTDEGALVAATAAPSDYGALLEVLRRPEAIRDLQQSDALDPLLPARLSGLQAREQLLTMGGGAHTAAQLAAQLGLSRQAVDHRRRTGKLLAVTLGRRGYLYPAWQCDGQQTLTGLPIVLAALREHDPWAQLAFMLNPNVWLDGETPLAVLRRGEVERVREAGSVYGEQVAA